MPGILQDWLGTRLGIILDISPHDFGRNTKDGTLLAKLLYSYGVIPLQVFEKIKGSKNCYDCYNNLVILKPWLSYIGVVEDTDTYRDMARGDGTAAISVFYAVYLNLERKDRFHYLSAQKERRFSPDSCQKFKVNWVPESQIARKSVETFELEAPLLEKRDVIDWHREKCLEVVEKIKKTKEKYKSTLTQKKKELGPLISKHPTSHVIDKKTLEVEETREKINSFEKKHQGKCSDLNYEELMDLKKKVEEQPSMVVPNWSESRKIVNSIKKRKKGEVYARSFQQKMELQVLDEFWKEILQKHDREFENAVCANLVKQSQYEKQMASKLMTIRNQKKIFAENRNKIESLKMAQRDKEYDDLVVRKMEERKEYWADEFEKERLKELHRRTYDEKVKNRRQKIKAEAQKICEALVDIAIRISEIRDVNLCQVPKAFVKDMKELFFKDLSIFDLFSNFEELYEPDNKMSENLEMEEEEEEEGEEVNRTIGEDGFLKCQEMERQKILDECDFNDYMQLLGPWMVELFFPEGSEKEVKHAVLGYIVHKLLAAKYPPPSAPRPSNIKPMKPVAVVQGLTDNNACNMFIDLMEACRVLVVKVEDAINFVLAAYKEELSVVRDIDISFQKATANALKDKTSNEKEKEVKKKIQLLKKDTPEKLTLDEEGLHQLDKESQTPRMIPEDDPLLSPNADLGKLAFEALGAGDPVSDPVIISAVIAYVLAKQDDYTGWVLLNYPLLYSQARDLEFSLIGYRTLPELEEMESLEDVEGFTFRGPWGHPFSNDTFAEHRVSRLVPKVDLLPLPPDLPRTYFDLFIKVKKEQPRGFSPEAEETSPLEKFYSAQKIFVNFEYQNLSFQSMKDLGKTILQKSQGDELEPKSSLEIFGNELLELNEKWNPSKKKNMKEKESSGGKKVKKESTMPSSLFLDITNEEETIAENPTEVPPPKPGDPDWEWASGLQPLSIQLALASIWENMEAVYVEDFKTMFFCLRVHRCNVVSYISSIKTSMKALMRRPDNKQKVLGEFQKMFNNMDEDLRPDVDIKCELHVRVSELEQALMNIADERKVDSLNDLRKIAEDSWVADEMASLVNIFLTALQLEADRCIDSCQVIMDYYFTLQQRVPDAKYLPKVTIPRLKVKNRKYSIVSADSNKGGSNAFTPRNSDSKRSSKSQLDSAIKLSKTRSWGDKKRKSTESGFLEGAAEDIREILKSLSLPEGGVTSFHSFFMDTIQTFTNEVKNTAEGCISEAKKGEKVQPKNQKKGSDTKGGNTGNFNLEWITALENELSRFVFRTKLILARGIFDMNEFLTTILNILSSLMEDIEEMYVKEIHSISDCCKVFRCGIEKETGIQPQLELKEDEFVINDEVLLFPNLPECRQEAEDEHKKLMFSIEQLSLLCSKLQQVAPNGEIIRQSLVYILEDLRMLKPEVEGFCVFPEVWNSIEPVYLNQMMYEIYQDLEIVHWKDFIIYAMELPPPTDKEILSMRIAFRKFDCYFTELIQREDYDQVRFWFEEALNHYKTVDRNEKAKDLLYRMYQVDEHRTNYSAILLAFCKDLNPVQGFMKALTLAMGKIILGVETDDLSFPAEEESLLVVSVDESIENNNNNNKTLCCPASVRDMKCIPREKILRCQCRDFDSSVTEESSEEMKLSYSENEGERGSLFYNPLATSFMHTGIPSNVLSSLLKACFPSLPHLSVLLDCKQTFQETLSSVYDSLGSCDDKVEAHRLVKHKFIDRLLHCTNKFKYVSIAKTLQWIVNYRNSMALTQCFPDQLDFSICLK